MQNLLDKHNDEQENPPSVRQWNRQRRGIETQSGNINLNIMLKYFCVMQLAHKGLLYLSPRAEVILYRMHRKNILTTWQ